MQLLTHATCTRQLPGALKPKSYSLVESNQTIIVKFCYMVTICNQNRVFCDTCTTTVAVPSGTGEGLPNCKPIITLYFIIYRYIKMADFEKDLLKFLAGKHPEYLTPIEYDLVIKPSICKMKSASLPRVCDDEPAMLKRNLTIIVGAVLLDKENKVLLIQEAKKKCRGLWYLPAGRLEENETIEVRK